MLTCWRWQTGCRAKIYKLFYFVSAEVRLLNLYACTHLGHSLFRLT